MGNAVILMVILVIATYRLSLAYKQGKGMSEWLAVVAYKAAGALAGSVIAAWFRKSARWALQIAAGAFFGYVSGHWLMDWRAWPPTPDYILLAGSIMGVVGYSVLEAVLSPDWKTLFLAWLDSRKATK